MDRLGLRSYGLFASALAFAAITACYTGPSANDGFLPTGVPQEPATDESATDPSGLPCDVAKLIADNCTSCHGTNLYDGAKTSLLTRAELMSELDGEVIASIALERMKDDAKPMPPDKPLAADQIAILEDWIAQGMPAGSCGEPATSAAPPADVATTCTSGTHWTRGTHESKLMKPGGKCIQCHTTGKTTSDHDDDDDDKKKKDDDDDDGELGPLFYFAGTVYPSAHDEDDCNGSDATATTSVVLTGADGQVLTLPINAAGNFYTKKNLVMPVTAKVVSAAGTRKMKAPVEDGDCNGCHTATSASPGRIVEKR